SFTDTWRTEASGIAPQGSRRFFRDRSNWPTWYSLGFAAGRLARFTRLHRVYQERFRGWLCWTYLFSASAERTSWKRGGGWRTDCGTNLQAEQGCAGRQYMIGRSKAVGNRISRRPTAGYKE